MLSTPFARVYYAGRGRPFSCYRITGRRVALDLGVDRFYSPGDARLGRLQIAGRVLGYTWIDPGIPAVYVHSVDMRTARFRRRTRVEPRVIIEPSAVAVTDLVVNRRGALAWIQRLEGAVSVWRVDSRGKRLLDAAPAIEPASLRRPTQARIAWTRDGLAETATLR